MDQSIVPIKGDSHATIALGRDYRLHKSQFSLPEQILVCEVMLLFACGSRIRRALGAFVSEDEIDTVTCFLKAQGEPAHIVMGTQRAPAKLKPPPLKQVAQRPAEDQGVLFAGAIYLTQERNQVTIASE